MASPPLATPSRAQGSAAPPPGSGAARSTPLVGADVLAVVDGIPITQAEWDRVATPYYREVEEQAGRKLNEDEKRLLRRNLLDELIRERLWVADARRRDMKIAPEAVDARMKQSPFFRVGGKVDEAKFQAYKRSPSSNYGELKPQVEMGLLLEEYTRWMERRFGPREAELKNVFQDRTTQASIRYFVMGPEAVSLEPEAPARDIRAYYDAHPQEFQTADSARIQFVKIPIEASASSDSARDAAAPSAMKAGNDLLQAIHAGAPPETAAKVYGGFQDSGWFRLGDPIRGLGRSDALAEAVKSGATGQWVAAPIRSGPHVLVVRLVDRRDARLLPFRDVVGLAKRRADSALRDLAIDSLAREEARLHPETYQVPRLAATVLARSLESFEDRKPLSSKDVDRALQRRRREAGVPESDHAWTDSTRAALPERLRSERRLSAAFKGMRDAAGQLRKGEPAARVAARGQAAASSFELYKGEPMAAPLLVEGALLDSLYTLSPGDVAGPRVRGDSIFVVRVERLVSDFLPPFEAVRTAARSNALLARRRAIEREAEGFFQSRRGEYLTKPKWAFDYVYFRKEAPESVDVPVDSIAAYWSRSPAEFIEPGRVKISVVLVNFRPGDGPEARERARQRAVAARERILKGEEFAAVAREISDDPTSAARGGDIGEATRGSLAKEIGDVAFSIPLGEVSEPVELRSGFHVLRVDSRVPERLRPLPECREEIQKVLGEAYGDSLAYGAAARMAEAAAAGSPFDSLAAPHGGASRAEPLGAGEPLPGIGAFETLGTDIGGLPDGGVTPEAIPVANGYLVARRVREAPPEPAPFPQVREQVVQDYQLHRRRAIADSLDTRIREALTKGADVESLLVPFGGLKSSRPFSRLGPVPDLARDPSLARDSTYLEKVFSSPPGTVLPPLKGSIGTLYATVESVTTPPESEFTRRRNDLWHEIVDERIEAWTARLRSRATVQIHRKDLRALLG